MALHVGFTGTRQGMTVRQAARLRSGLRSTLRAYRALARAVETDEVAYLHHGRCLGADIEAAEIARRLGYRTWGHPATGVSKGSADYGDDVSSRPEAPLVRNRTIVDFAEVMFAAPDSDRERRRSGTWATIRRARERRRQGFVLFPDGRFRALASIDDSLDDHVGRHLVEVLGGELVLVLDDEDPGPWRSTR